MSVRHNTAIRKALKGHRRSEVAAAARVDVSYITHLMAGRRVPSLAVAYRLAAYLGTSIETLFPPQSVRRQRKAA